MHAPWPYVDTVHGKPESPSPDALLSGVLALFVGEEIGTDESGVFAPEDAGVRKRQSGDRRCPRQPMAS